MAGIPLEQSGVSRATEFRHHSDIDRDLESCVYFERNNVADAVARLVGLQL